MVSVGWGRFMCKLYLLVDAIENANIIYAAGSICCQIGSALMIANPFW